MIKNQTLVQERGLRPKSENPFPRYQCSIWAKGGFWGHFHHHMGYISAYSYPIWVLRTKVPFQKVRKMTPRWHFPRRVHWRHHVWERNKGLVATNKLKTMRRHPGIPPEGKRVPLKRLESSNSKQWGIFSLFQRVSQNQIVPLCQGQNCKKAHCLLNSKQRCGLAEAGKTEFWAERFHFTSTDKVLCWYFHKTLSLLKKFLTSTVTTPIFLRGI